MNNITELKPPVEVRYKEELEALRALDTGRRPELETFPERGADFYPGEQGTAGVERKKDPGEEKISGK